MTNLSRAPFWRHPGRGPPGQPPAAHQFEVVRLSDPARAAPEIAEAGADAARAIGYEIPQSDGQRANQLRTKLGSGLKSIENFSIVC